MSDGVLAVLRHAAERRAEPDVREPAPPIDLVIPVPAEDVVLDFAARAAAEVAAGIRVSTLADFLR